MYMCVAIAYGVIIRNVAISISCDRSDYNVCMHMSLAARRSQGLDEQLFVALTN